MPIFAHVNWFQRDPEDGHFLWPGYRDNLRPLLWLLQLKNGEVTGRHTPVGILPTKEELNLEGVEITPRTSTRSCPSTPNGGAGRWRTASSTWPSSTACPMRSGRRIVGSREARREGGARPEGQSRRGGEGTR